MTGLRRALLMGMAVFVVLVAVAPARAAEACGHACSTNPKLTEPGERTQHCLPDAGCGGGSLLTAGTGSIALAAATGIIVVAGGLLRRRVTLRSVLPTGRLLATRLFRPPQFSLSV